MSMARTFAVPPPPQPDAAASEDHRVRVAAARRERMRMRLVESALHVFADKGLDAADIQDVIEHAQVSRGSFYNYFRTNEELMAAVLEALSNELLDLVDAVVTSRKDPAERVACGIRMVLHAAWEHGLYARFVARVGIERAIANSLALQYLPRDIRAGMASGQFHVAHLMSALVLALGTTHAAICAMSMSGELPPDFPGEVACQVLLGLGMSRAAARKRASGPIEPVVFPDGSLLARTLPRGPQEG
jgi:AcrR family transcriptional regulator